MHAVRVDVDPGDIIHATVGGTYRMSFTNFTTGSSHSFSGEYLELNRIIDYAELLPPAPTPAQTIAAKQ